MRYPVAEIFDTIQGEGHWTGTPSTFIRLQGCDVGCPWCDTKYTWDASAAPLSVEADEMVSDLLSESPKRLDRLWVFTGGEPCMYDLQIPTYECAQVEIQAQIETSGTYEIRCDDRTWVTVSPKFAMPGGRTVLDSALERANEIKLVVGRTQDVERAQQLRDSLGDVKFSLQPLSESPKATALCVEACLEHGFQLSVQTHKAIGIP